MMMMRKQTEGGCKMKRNMMDDLKRDEIEAARIAKSYPVGTKLHQTNGGPTGEVVEVKGNYDGIRVIRTNGVDREAQVRQIDVYAEKGIITVEGPAE
jgi:hypothetical protein